MFILFSFMKDKRHLGTKYSTIYIVEYIIIKTILMQLCCTLNIFLMLFISNNNIGLDYFNIAKYKI